MMTNNSCPNHHSTKQTFFFFTKLFEITFYEPFTVRKDPLSDSLDLIIVKIRSKISFYNHAALKKKDLDAFL